MLFDANVLLVEDLADMGESVGPGLLASDPGLHLQTCEPAVVRSLIQPCPSVILVDLAAVESALAVLVTLRCEPVLAGVPILVLSSCGAAELRTRFGEAGAQEVLVKPLNTADLALRVRYHAAIKQRDRAVADLRSCQERLETATRELARAEAEPDRRAWSAYVARLGQDIRTPMNGILGLTRLALHTDLTPRQREYLRGVWSSADTLMAVLNGVLEFCQIETGGVEIASVPFDIRSCMDEALRTLAFRAHEKNLELACQIPASLPARLMGDPARLRQVVVNLVGNAVKFTTRGEVVVRVVVDEQSAETLLLHLAVSDTGPGVSEEQQQCLSRTVFDGRPAPPGESRGVGLAVSARLVARMGGRMWLESHVGEGSIFHFTCRLGLLDSLSPPAPPERLRGLQVLVVDDNVTHRDILVDMLDGLGVRTATASTEQEALQALSGRLHHAVVVDHKAGAQLVDAVRNSSVHGRPAFVILTTATRLEGDPPPVSGQVYQAKPVSASVLAQRLLASLASLEADSADGERLPNAMPSLRILLADDNPINQMVAANLLQGWQHSVTVVSDGMEAVHRALTERFDLVLMDVHMPGMDGFEATAAIRQAEGKDGAGRVPIIAFTAAAVPDSPGEVLARGLDGWLAKPLQERHLIDEIRRLVPRSGPTSGAGRGLESMEQAGETSGSAVSTSPIDDAFLRHTLGSNPSMLRRICRLFLEMGPEQVRDIQVAVQGRNWLKVQKAAHKLRGSVGTFGANAAVQAAQNLETAALGTEREAVEAALAELERQVDRMLPAISRLLDEVSSQGAAPGPG